MIIAFISFTFLTSGIYIFNDIFDYPFDRINEQKKNRPIASDRISRSEGWKLFILFTFLAFITNLVFRLGEYFLLIELMYFVLMVSYSVYFRNIAIIDSLIIAMGFVIRIIGGAFVIGETQLYSWIIVVVISLSLLISIGKRKSEMTMFENTAHLQRKVLGKYSEDFLNSLLSGLFATTFLAYVLLTFQMDISKNIFSTTLFLLPKNIARSPHLLKLTIPIAFYGLARYMYIIYQKKTGGTPEKALFTDIPLVVTAIIFVLSVIYLLYAGK